MKFKAHYMTMRGDKSEYWRELRMDTLNEAIREADKFTRKGYICVGIKQQEGCE